MTGPKGRLPLTRLAASDFSSLGLLVAGLRRLAAGAGPRLSAPAPEAHGHLGQPLRGAAQARRGGALPGSERHGAADRQIRRFSVARHHRWAEPLDEAVERYLQVSIANQAGELPFESVPLTTTGASDGNGDPPNQPAARLGVRPGPPGGGLEGGAHRPGDPVLLQLR